MSNLTVPTSAGTSNSDVTVVEETRVSRRRNRSFLSTTDSPIFHPSALGLTEENIVSKGIHPPALISPDEFDARNYVNISEALSNFLDLVVLKSKDGQEEKLLSELLHPSTSQPNLTNDIIALYYTSSTDPVNIAQTIQLNQLHSELARSEKNLIIVYVSLDHDCDEARDELPGYAYASEYWWFAHADESTRKVVHDLAYELSIRAVPAMPIITPIGGFLIARNAIEEFQLMGSTAYDKFFYIAKQALYLPPWVRQRMGPLYVSPSEPNGERKLRMKYCLRAKDKLHESNRASKRPGSPKRIPKVKMVESDTSGDKSGSRVSV